MFRDWDLNVVPTHAIPLSIGIAFSNFLKASNPPAEALTPITGKQIF
jgi:hypothetical protein